MKDGLKNIVGKQIAAVVVAKSEQAPNQQVFLVFPDGTCFEFYGQSFTCCSGLDNAEGIERYVASRGGEIVRVYGETVSTRTCGTLPAQSERLPYPMPAQDTLADQMTR